MPSDTDARDAEHEPIVSLPDLLVMFVLVALIPIVAEVSKAVSEIQQLDEWNELREFGRRFRLWIRVIR